MVEKTSPLHRIVLWLRDLHLPSSGLRIGENRFFGKKDADGTQNLYFGRQDGTEDKVSGDVPAARVHNSGNITTGSGSWHTLTFDSERWDNDTIHAAGSPTRLTAITAGRYVIDGGIRFAASTGGDKRAIRILLNASTIIKQHGTTPRAGSHTTELSIGTSYDLAADDYVRLQSYQDSGGNLDVLATANISPEFGMIRIGPAGSGAGAVGDDHGGLSGLGDVSDHPGYLLTTGARAGSTGTAQDFGSTGIKADVIAESTGAAGVTIDGVKLKDSEPYCDVINEKTGAAGVTIDTLLIKDGNLTGPGGSALTISPAANQNLALSPSGTGLLTVANPLSVTTGGAAVATAGIIRLPNNQSIVYRNAANNGNLTVLTVTAGDEVQYGVDVFLVDNFKFKVGTGKDGEFYGTGDDVHLHNVAEDADLVFGIDDGGVSKTITWDADVNKLLFDDDTDLDMGAGALSTTGALGAGEATLTDGASLNLQEAITFTGATTENLIEIPDNLADALSVKEGANAYLTIDTTDGAEKVISEKSLYIKEQAAALADVAAYGQLWVKTATPNELWFTDDAGTDVQLGVGGGGGCDTAFYNLTVEDPTSSEDVYIGFTKVAITVSEVRGVVKGSSPSVTINPKHSTDRSAAGNALLDAATAITSTTTGTTITGAALDDVTIPANSHIWLETTAKSGTVDELGLSITASID